MVEALLRTGVHAHLADVDMFHSTSTWRTEYEGVQDHIALLNQLGGCSLRQEHGSCATVRVLPSTMKPVVMV
jgi:hypothetical protein